MVVIKSLGGTVNNEPWLQEVERLDRMGWLDGEHAEELREIIRLHRAKWHMDAKELDKAFQILRQGSDKVSETSSSLTRKWAHAQKRLAGRYMYVDKEYVQSSFEALLLLEKALIVFGDDFEVWLEYGLAQRLSGHFQEAIATYQQATALNPKSSSAHNGLGKVYSDLGRHEEAIAAYQQATALDPKSSSPYNGLGMVYSALGRHKEAIAACQQAIALDPKGTIPLLNLGKVYSALGRHEEAIAAYQKAIALKPQDADLHRLLGQVYHQLGKYEEAIAAYQQAKTLDPQCSMVYNSLGSLYYTLRQYNEAIVAYQQVIALNPNIFSPYANIAKVYLLQKDFQSAETNYETSIKLYPGVKLFSCVGLGIIETIHDRLSTGSERFRKAKENFHTWQYYLPKAEALECKAIALLCLGHRDEAIQTMHEAVKELMPGDDIDLFLCELLKESPHPPEGIEEIISILKEAEEKRNQSNKGTG
jgi:Flp pilus assembly protein TadD